jgi:glycosyltransferase involved in cell wall biosynthesis
MTSARQLRILAPTRYPWRFNSPRHSKHQIDIRNFVPLNYLSKKIEGITIFNPFPPRRFDLIHAFNRIPISTLPYVIGFESHLPRGFGIETSAFFKFMTRRLASTSCRAIVAMSNSARRFFLHMHASSPYYHELCSKLHVRFPNMILDPIDDLCQSAIGEHVRVCFVGQHFGRKGGCVALRMAELAFERKLPLFFDVVSSFVVGRDSWTDPTDPGYFDRYRQLLDLPNVRYHGSLPNSAVHKLLLTAHFSLLATFSDTFAYSAIEAMANYVPVVATTQGALPEFIRDGFNGVLLDLATDEFGEWIHLHDDRSSPAYAALHRAEIERLAHVALDRILSAAADPKGYAALRQNARATALRLFSADDASLFWDGIYEYAVDGVIRVPDQPDRAQTV